MTEQAERIALQARRAGDRETLFWSERGAVCCATHAPYPGSDTWIWERWLPMKEAETREWTRLLGHPPKCEVCQ
jgi:hypothetical protein